MNKNEYQEYEQDVKTFCDTENIVSLDAICDPDDGYYEPYFSHINCDCCRRSLSGDRLDCIAYNKNDHEIYNYTVCLDCYYYFEYGCLDDTTMDEIAWNNGE